MPDYRLPESEKVKTTKTPEKGQKTLKIERLLVAIDADENIADLLDEKTLETIGARVVQDFDADDASRADWKERSAEAIDLAMQVRQIKTEPWPNCSNVKFPLLTIGSFQFASRALPQIVRKPAPVRGKINGKPTAAKQRKALRKGSHMSWQLTEGMPGWMDDQDLLLHVLPILGCGFKKIFRDGRHNRNVSEFVSPTNLVYDYHAKNVTDARRKTHWFDIHPQQLESRKRAGFYRDCDYPRPSGDDRDELEEQADDVQGLDGSEAPKDDTPHRMLEQHAWWDLDGDDLEEPYIITVEKESKTVARIAGRYDAETVMFAEDGTVLDFDPIEHFVQYPFFPDPTGGNLGIGWGQILTPINETVNSLVNILIDSGTLATEAGGVYAKELAKGLPSGQKQLSMKKWTAVNASWKDIRQSILPWPVNEPSQVLFSLLGLMIEWGQRLTTVTDTMQGENPPTNQPATTTLTLLEQGLMVFQGIYERVYRSFDRELKLLERLNKKYMPPEEYYRVLDLDAEETQELLLSTMTPEEIEAAQYGMGIAWKTDYDDDGTDVSPSADPSVQTEQQQIARTRVAVEGLGLGLPLSPQWLATRWLDAIQIPKDEQEGAVVPPQPPPPDPKIVAEEMRGQMKQMELALRKTIEDQKRRIDLMKIMVQGKKDMTDAELEAAQLVWDQYTDERDLDQEDERLDIERMKARKDAKKSASAEA